MASENDADAKLKTEQQKEELKQAIADLNFSLSSDSMVASIDPPDGLMQGYTLETLKATLQAAGIFFGTVSDELLQDYLSDKPLTPKPWKVAEGVQPQAPEDPSIQYYFDSDSLKVGELDEYGNIDFKQRGKVAQVKAEDLLAELVPGSPGKPGKNVYGLIIPPAKSRSVKLECGKGVRQSEDGLRAFAEIDGRPSIDFNNKLSVLPDYTISGDVGYETGHVEFDGHIEVQGTIQDGFRIKGRSLQAGEINRADIDITGNISVNGGVIGATVKSNGILKARHLHTAVLEIRGDVLVESQIFDSQIQTNGKCNVQSGKILTSKISAKKGVYAVDIGSETSQACVLTVGQDEFLKRDLAPLQDQIKSYAEEQKFMSEALQKLGVTAENLETEIGELAQEEDRARVQLAALNEKMKKLQGTSPGILQAKQKAQELNKIIKSKIDVLSAKIEKSFQMQEDTEQEIKDLQVALKDNQAAAQAVGEQIKQMQALSLADKSLAIVRANGVIYAGTIIQGPRTKLVLRENHQNATVKEVRNPNDFSSKAWNMQIGHGGR